MAALALQRAAAVPRGDGEHRQVGLHGGRGGLALRGAARLRQRPQGLHREQPRRDLPEPRRCRGTGPGLRGGALGTTGGGLGKAPGVEGALGGAAWGDSGARSRPGGLACVGRVCLPGSGTKSLVGVCKCVQVSCAGISGSRHPNCTLSFTKVSFVAEKVGNKVYPSD